MIDMYVIPSVSEGPGARVAARGTCLAHRPPRSLGRRTIGGSPRSAAVVNPFFGGLRVRLLDASSGATLSGYVVATNAGGFIAGRGVEDRLSSLLGQAGLPVDR